ncbi:MAG TPA: hypothetical protein VK582_24095 [Pyrinomonadaceae bacterium]|nr:hypothetical protein [Pyrinomonadaceae bacterium]
MHIRLAVSLLALIFCLWPTQLSRRAGAAGTGDWFFVVVETHVHPKSVKADSDDPEERRWYVSNAVALPANIPDYSSKKKAGEYFDTNVVEPAKTHGILVDYYDDEMQINGGSVLAVGTREQAEQMRNKDLADRKEQGGNIYSFELVFGPAKGEDTSKPKLIYRDKKQPSYSDAKASQPSDR